MWPGGRARLCFLSKCTLAFVVLIHYSWRHSGPRAFSSHFSYLLSFADHPSSPTLIHSQVPAAAAIVVSYWKEKKKKSKAPLLPDALPTIFHL